MFSKEDVQLLDDYKEKYDQVYITEINGEEFLWREVNRKEFNKLTQYFPDSYEREEELCRMCLLEPEEYDFENCFAGIPFTLASQILYESGFSPSGEKVNEMLAHYRGKVNSFEGRADALITEAFPTIRVEEIETWSTEKILRYYALAEYKLISFRGAQLSEGNSQEDSCDPDDFPELRGM